MKVNAAHELRVRGRQHNVALLMASLHLLVWPTLVGCSDHLPTPTSPPQPTQSTERGPAVAPQEPVAKAAVELAEPGIATTDETAPKPSASVMQFDPERLKLSMVALGTANEGWLAYGVVVGRSSTGFDVVTADHVLDGRKNVMVQAWQGDGASAKLQSFLSVTVMHRAPDKDLAWVRVRASASDVVPLSIAPLRERDRQAVWTYHVNQQKPIFESHEIDKRLTAKREGQATAVSYWRLMNRIEPGLSGGALVDETGQWIGIASGNNQNQAHYVDPSEIISFLKEAGLR